MMKFKFLTLLVALILVVACTKEANDFKIDIPGWKNGDVIPAKYAMCVPDSSGKVEFSANINPHVRWSGAPEETQSLVLIFADLDVPEDTRFVNTENKIIEEDVERKEFYHWVLIDIPPARTEIPEGIASNSVKRGGKPAQMTPYGRQGLNDYTYWFRGDQTMGGIYGGYDGPCPPWNDEKIHRYRITLYALDIESLGLTGRFTAGQAQEMMQDHILARTEWQGIYTVNSKFVSQEPYSTAF